MPRLKRTRRLASNVANFQADSYHHAEHWSQKLVPGYLAGLAIDMELQTHVDFAEHSLALHTDAGTRQAFAEEVYTLAGDAPDTLSISFLKNTVHASFDRRDFFADRLRTVTNLQTELQLP